MDLVPNLIQKIRAQHVQQDWFWDCGLQPNKKCLVLNFPSFILKIHMICNTIILREIARRNNGIDDKTLQFMHLDHWFYMLSPMKVVWIIELLGNGVWEWLRYRIRRCGSHGYTDLITTKDGLSIPYWIKLSDKVFEKVRKCLRRWENWEKRLILLLDWKVNLSWLQWEVYIDLWTFTLAVTESNQLTVKANWIN